MASPNEIGAIKKIMIKPIAWKVIEHLDNFFTIDFTYVEVDRGEWAEVRTRRGGIKTYKTINAVLSDLKKVDKSPIVYFFLI